MIEYVWDLIQQEIFRIFLIWYLILSALYRRDRFRAIDNRLDKLEKDRYLPGRRI